MKRIIQLVCAVVVVLMVVVLVRTYIPSGTQKVGMPYAYEPDVAQVAQSLSQAVQIKTISYGRNQSNSESEMLAFHQYLEQRFPLVHRSMKRETIATYSLLYSWAGTSTNEKPILLLGHIDVVPVIPGTEELWVHPPFSGKIDDGYIWGRGTLDDKVTIIGLFSAAEALLEAGFTPKRTIYFAFGHDEEIGGLSGAASIAATLKERGVKAEFVLDEGGAVSPDIVDGTKTPLALIAPAEKGIVNMTLTARHAGGHSSVPPKQTAIGIIAAAIARLEADQFPKDFTLTRQFLESVADDFEMPNRLLMKNLWLFEPLVRYSLRDNEQALAGMRTTTATTIIEGGVKANVLPISAKATLNFRIYPGETPATVMARVKEVVNDQRVEVAFDEGGQTGMGPSPVAPTQGFAWETIVDAIHDTAAPDPILIAPRLLVGATDTRHYRAISDKHYRFIYMWITREDFKGYHGTNERIGVQAFKDTVRFYHRLLSVL